MPALWTIGFEELGLSVRVQNVLRIRGARTAWHAAIFCHYCLTHTRNCGKQTVAEIRTALEREGLPASRHDCGDHPYQGPSRCDRELAQCRAMLERGEWG